MRADCAEEAGNTGRFSAGTLVRMEGLVDRIREVMELRGWTAYEFAHRAQLSDSILSNWLRRGVKRPDLEALNKLAAAGDPLMVAPMTPGLLIDLADALVDHVPAPSQRAPKPRT